MAITQLPPLSLYVHFPWCVKKCPYCDFNSHAVNHSIPEADYIDALIADLEQELPAVWGRSITSIFIGGGTPSLMSVKAVDNLLSGIRARLPFLSEVEITMEANPGVVEANNFKGYFDSGVNRISIGAQSFENKFLSELGRVHSSSEAIQAFEIARNAGFKNINIDLMYGLPGQSVQEAMDDLDKAISLKPEHLSWYQLTLEPNTPFHHTPPAKMATDDHIADIGESGLALLKRESYQRYEISAFSVLGMYPAWHNTNYWQFGDYIGIGAGAHGKITRADTQQITRTSKKRNPKDYLDSNKTFIDQHRTLSPQALPLEFMMNAARLKDGVDESLFYQTTGILLSQIEQPLIKCIDKGLIVWKDNKITPSGTGYLFLNDILSEFTDDHFKHLSIDNRINITEVK